MTTINEELEAAADLQSVLDGMAETKYSEKLPTLNERRAFFLSAIKDTDIDALLNLQDKMSKMIDKITANNIDLESLGEYTEEELMAFMVELIDSKEIEALLKVRYSMLRAAIFANITERNVAKKIAHPEHAPGEIPVPELGKKFVRQGGNLIAGLNKTKLAELLGEKMWSRVNKAVIVPEVVIPEHVEYTFDEDALLGLVQESPTVMEAIRACVTEKGFTPSSLYVRPLTKPEKAEDE